MNTFPYFTSSRPPRLFGHRGASGYRPENTIPSFQLALELNARYLELDVRMTRDGHVIVLHDEFVNRTTNGQGAAVHMPLEAIKSLDAGYGFRSEDGKQPFAGKEIRIPTLGEILQTFPDAFFNIEIKQASPPMEEPMEEVLIKHKAMERVLLAAADGEIMARIRRRFGGRLATGISRDEGYRLMQWILGGRREHFTLKGQALQIPDTLNGRHYISKDLIDVVHELGLEVHIWTVNDPERMQELLKMGADGIMTDYPDRFYISKSETNSSLERQNDRNTP